MNENLNHHITNSIKSYYTNRLIAPIVFLALLILLAIFYPVGSMIFPTEYDSSKSISELYDEDHPYITIDLTKLYFTGYTEQWLDRTTGYYYYTMVDDNCIILLLDPETCDQGNPTIESLSLHAEILKDSIAMDRLLDSLSEDLNWTKSGIRSTISRYMLSEVDATNYKTKLFCLLYIVFFLYAIISIIRYTIYRTWPATAPSIRKLSCYGNPKKMLLEAEEELQTLPQLATDDMFITEHYFIETSNFGVAVVPIKEMIWIYKYSTLHKFFWHHFSISYTLYITCNKHFYIHCPKNTKTDIDGIIDYLSEANHDTLVGFSEENRRKVESLQGDTILLRKILAFLSKRV